LDSEVGTALLDDDGLCGIEEPLNALRCPQLGRLDRPLDRTLLPGRFLAWATHRSLETVQKRRTWLNCTGERCANVIWKAPAAHVSEIVTFA
jgi:hypothetical protein